ncbi:MAG: sigma-70 family RNA polymerase sigma factor [Deltaproteobacteria bacterium]|nr:sigma-70 family RNA polymerase sigma factor [Deltaproteobacteria bacterium]
MESDDEFVEAHRPLVASIAQKVSRQLDLRGEMDDLLAAGFQGLVEAQGRYDAGRGVKFNTFAYYRIRGAIIDWVRQQGFHSRRAWQRVKAAEAVDLLGESVVQERASDPAARRDRGRTAASLDGAMDKITAAFVMAAVGQDEQTTDQTPESELLGGEQGEALRQAVSRLPDRERTLLLGFYFQDRHLEDVAAELGISKSWASRLHTRALNLLGKQLRAQGLA